MNALLVGHMNWTYLIVIMENMQIILGRNIAKIRKERLLTQAMVAERLQIEPESVSRFERGATAPSLMTLKAISMVLNTTVADLLCEFPGEAYSDAQKIARMLQFVPVDRRAEVTTIIEKICHLASKGADAGNN